MNLTIACSYCRRQLILKLTAPIVVSANIGPPVKCEACGSTTQIEISTLRKTKGRGMKDIEARAKAKLDTAIEAARTRNAEIGARLLLDPGCTCQALHDRSTKTFGYSVGRGDGGHFLSTGWGQDKDAGGMLPTIREELKREQLKAEILRDMPPPTPPTLPGMAAQLAEHVTASAPIVPAPAPQPKPRESASDLESAVHLILESIPNLQTFTINVDEHGEASVDYQIRRVTVTTEGGSLKVKR